MPMKAHKLLPVRFALAFALLLGLLLFACPLWAGEAAEAASEPAAAATETPAWKVKANEVIEQVRKRDAQVTVVDAEGKPIAGAKLSIRQTRKAFPFGCVVDTSITRSGPLQERFKQMFNFAVFGNEAKWYSNESARGRVNYRAADQLLAWCDANDIPVHGHCVFWEPEKWQPGWVRSLRGEELRTALENRLVDSMTHFKGRFASWDVNNEMLHGTFYIDRLGEDIRVWMFKRAREVDPDVKLHVNDFNILSVDQDFKEVETEQYLAQILKLIEQGAPIDRVGVQGHIWTEDILGKPEVIRERFDIVAKAGLPIWVSEFDVADRDANVRADKLELLYRTAYGHPLVEGITTWSFAGSWRGNNATIVNRNGTPNAAGQRYLDLMEEWSTSLDAQTDAKGRYDFRGFHGDYEATITLPGADASQKPVVQKFALKAGKDAQEIELKVE